MIQETLLMGPKGLIENQGAPQGLAKEKRCFLNSRPLRELPKSSANGGADWNGTRTRARGEKEVWAPLLRRPPQPA